MFYTFKNAPLKINNIDFLANQVQLSEETSLTPAYLDGERHASTQTPISATVGAAKINYVITGADPLKPFFSRERTVISGNFAGLYFESGYLRSYNVNFVPNSPAYVDAEIIFFDEIKGSFVSQTTKEATYNSVLNHCDTTVSNLAVYSDEALGTVTSIDLQFTSDIRPSYVIEDNRGNNAYPIRPVFGPKQITTQIVTDSLQASLPISGRKLGCVITVQNPNDLNSSEIYTVSGILTNRSIDTNTKGLVQSNWTITQNSMSVIPIIDSFSPAVGGAGTLIKIMGEELDNSLNLIIGDTLLKSFQVINDENLHITVPPEANSGPIVVETFDGRFETENDFTVTYPEISISQLVPATGQTGVSMLIEGTNFYRIDSVKFAGHSSQFRVINPELIEATVPNCPMSYVQIESSTRQKTGISSYQFATPPVITGFYPTSGVYQGVITVRGSNFSGITNAYFGDIEATYSITNTGLATIDVPTGYVHQFIKFKNSSGVIGEAPWLFDVGIRLTGIYPLSGVENSSVQLQTSGVRAEYLKFFDENIPTYEVSFNGASTGFYLSASHLLTGLVPSNIETGPVFIKQANGSDYYSNVTFTYIDNQPDIYDYSPKAFISGGLFNISLRGDDLLNIKQISISGSGVIAGNGIFGYHENQASITETTTKRVLKGTSRNDLLGIAANVITTEGLQNNGFLTGVLTGYYHLYAESAGGFGSNLSGIKLIQQPNLALSSATRISTNAAYVGTPTPPATSDPYTLIGVSGHFVTNALAAKPTVTFDLGRKCKVLKVKTQRSTDAAPYTAVADYDKFIEVQLLRTGSILATGKSYALASSNNHTFYFDQTGYGVWNWTEETDQVKIINHSIYVPTVTQQATYISMDKVYVYGIPPYGLLE